MVEEVEVIQSIRVRNACHEVFGEHQGLELTGIVGILFNVFCGGCWYSFGYCTGNDPNVFRCVLTKASSEASAIVSELLLAVALAAV